MAALSADAQIGLAAEDLIQYLVGEIGGKGLSNETVAVMYSLLKRAVFFFQRLVPRFQLPASLLKRKYGGSFFVHSSIVSPSLAYRTL